MCTALNSQSPYSAPLSTESTDLPNGEHARHSSQSTKHHEQSDMLPSPDVLAPRTALSSRWLSILLSTGQRRILMLPAAEKRRHEAAAGPALPLHSCLHSRL